MKTVEDLVGFYDLDGTPIEVRMAPDGSGDVECLAHDTPEPRPFSFVSLLRGTAVIINQARFEYLKSSGSQ